MVKTRLGREIGMIDAAWWFRHQTGRLIRAVARDRRWRTVLAVAPDHAIASRAWPPGIARWPQGPGDLGARMARALAHFGPGPVAIVGGDVPGVGPREIGRAFALARGGRAVLGPAADGGYWLVAVPHGGRLPAGLFAGVRWSGPHALSDTEATLGPLAPARRAAMLHDVDTAADLRAQRGRGA
ncbi:DUF2064 domain-containing protein [Limibaculum sp. M0105]|uniref:DUF2064 domain-containing protein n=2 Tax=Thermohalobaculum xanthum TaxID=2753746 RepID=A0A8J7MA52_9RHOB|nr:DUF2064 domain-containing protein [Thermohalobaculum xanthum]